MTKAAQSEADKLTPEQAIVEIRRLRAGRLHVGNDEYTDLLLAEYDKLLEEISEAFALLKKLREAISVQDRLINVQNETIADLQENQKPLELVEGE